MLLTLEVLTKTKNVVKRERGVPAERSLCQDSWGWHTPEHSDLF